MSKGYTVISEADDHIIVGMSFAHFNKNCEPSITYNGR